MYSDKDKYKNNLIQIKTNKLHYPGIKLFFILEMVKVKKKIDFCLDKYSQINVLLYQYLYLEIYLDNV